MTLEHDSRLKFLKLLGYSRDELQKKVSIILLGDPAQDTWPQSITNAYLEKWVKDLGEYGAGNGSMRLV